MLSYFNDYNWEFVTLVVLSFVGELRWSQKNGRFTATSHSEFSAHSICSCRQPVDINCTRDEFFIVTMLLLSEFATAMTFIACFLPVFNDLEPLGADLGD